MVDGWRDARRPRVVGGTVFEDERCRTVDAPEDATFRVLSRIGGRYGYWGADWLWRCADSWTKRSEGQELREADDTQRS